MITKAARSEVRDEGVVQGRAGVLDFVGAGVTASVSGNIATVSIPGGSGVAFTEFETPLIGPVGGARRSGHFTIVGAGFTTDKFVLIKQAAGPYFGKGTRFDEAEMDSISLTAKVRDATTIDVYWTSQYRVKGFYKFAYLISS